MKVEMEVNVVRQMVEKVEEGVEVGCKAVDEIAAEEIGDEEGCKAVDEIAAEEIGDEEGGKVMVAEGFRELSAQTVGLGFVSTGFDFAELAAEAVVAEAVAAEVLDSLVAQAVEWVLVSTEEGVVETAVSQVVDLAQ